MSQSSTLTITARGQIDQFKNHSYEQKKKNKENYFKITTLKCIYEHPTNEIP